MIWIYNFLLTLTALIWVPFMLIKSRKRAEQPNWKERTGNIERKFQKEDLLVWVHAVSVGEVIAAGPFIKELKRQEPECKVLLSVTTSSGHQAAEKSLLSSGMIDQLSYFPIDVVRFTLSALTRVRPNVVAIMETELWLNFLWSAKQIGAKTMLVNGRISERSFKKSVNVRAYYRAIFSYLGVALMQTEEDASRAKQLGATRTEVVGNMKFDDVSSTDTSFTSQWYECLQMKPGEFPVLIVGSARGEKEHELILDALSVVLQKLPELRVVYAPRHIEDADALAAQIKSKLGSVARRSLGDIGPIILLDTYGELSQSYAIGDMAIIGGGFDNLGGQNLLQPMEAGLPVIRGPNFQNFQWIVNRAGENEGVFVAKDVNELSKKVIAILNDQDSREALGKNASQFVKSHQGASKIYAQKVLAEAKLSQAKRLKKMSKNTRS